MSIEYAINNTNLAITTQKGNYYSDCDGCIGNCYPKYYCDEIEEATGIDCMRDGVIFVIKKVSENAET